MIKYLKILAVITMSLMPLVIVNIVSAIDDPDSNPTVSNIKANVYLIDEGDMLIYGEYNIPYASVPDEGADEAFIFRLIDTDGETELGSVTPYVLFDNGYNEGVFGFYFSSNTTWGESSIIRISQNPVLFDDPTSYEYAIPSNSYSTKTTQEDNQIELAINIISAAQRLETAHSGYTLLEASAGGTILSSPTGETYFRGAIPGIQAMAPDLFLVQVLAQDTTAREWTTDQFDTYQDRYEGTWVGDDVDATATQFGITAASLMGTIIALPICIGVIILSAMKYKRTEPGIIVSTIILILTSLMGWMPTAIFATSFQLMAIYLSYVLFYSRG